MSGSKLVFAYWVIFTVMLAAYISYRFFAVEDRTAFLPGATSDAHYQIELKCEACHDPMMGVKEQACIDCHGEELRLANDTHPKGKFRDPRNASLLSKIAANDCITCHHEHEPERTRPMDVTVPADVCAHCHESIGDERPSHAGMGFDTCAAIGCHNFHDNTALYEDFLLKHAGEPDLLADPRVPARNFHAFHAAVENPSPLTREDARHPATAAVNDAILTDWATTAHASAGVNCADCHSLPDPSDPTRTVWNDHPGDASCATCHETISGEFLASRHGMRLAQDLSPMTPGLARLPMKSAAGHDEMTCNACHAAHTYDTRSAAVDSCLTCHDDAHSLAYIGSPHHDLWLAELAGEAPPGTGVSCATCHLPRETHRQAGHERVTVQHNQNANLRPVEKQLRTVCLDCHGLGFSIDALADPALRQNNFRGQPAAHVESIDMAIERDNP